MRIFLFSFCLLAACSLSSTGSSPENAPTGLSPESKIYISRLIGGVDGNSPLTNGSNEALEVATNGDINNWSDYPLGHERKIKFIGAVEGLANSAYYQDDFLYTGVTFASSVDNAEGEQYPIPGIIVLTMDEKGIFQAALDKSPTRDEITDINNALGKSDPTPIRKIAKFYYARGNFKPLVPDSFLKVGSGNSFTSGPWVLGEPTNHPFSRK